MCAQTEPPTAVGRSLREARVARATIKEIFAELGLPTDTTDLDDAQEAEQVASP